MTIIGQTYRVNISDSKGRPGVTFESFCVIAKTFDGAHKQALKRLASWRREGVFNLRIVAIEHIEEVMRP